MLQGHPANTQISLHILHSELSYPSHDMLKKHCHMSDQQRLRSACKVLQLNKNHPCLYDKDQSCFTVCHNSMLLLILKPAAGCSKLTTLLVNISLKFQMLIWEIHQYFMLKTCEELLQCKSFSHFFSKNISVFGYKVVKHLTS